MEITNMGLNDIAAIKNKGKKVTEVDSDEEQKVDMSKRLAALSE